MKDSKICVFLEVRGLLHELCLKEREVYGNALNSVREPSWAFINTFIYDKFIKDVPTSRESVQIHMFPITPAYVENMNVTILTNIYD